MEWLGRRPEEMIGIRMQDLFGSRLFNENEPPIRRALNGRTQRFERTLTKPNGEIGHVWAHYVPDISEDDATVRGFFVLVSDITELKRAQQAISESEQRLRSAFDFAGIATGIVALFGWFLRVNRRLCDLVGYAEEDLLQKKFQDITHPEDIEGSLLSLWDLLEGRSGSVEVENRLIHRREHIVWGRITGTAVHAADGSPLQLVVQIEDITERRRIERALRESEERNRLFVEFAPASVAMFDRKMRYLVHSTQWLKDYQLEGHDLIGRSHYEAFPGIGENWKEIHRRCLAGATEVTEAELFIRDDGQRQWLSWRVQPWHTASGAIGGTVIFTADISDRMLITEELRQNREQLQAAVRVADIGIFDYDHVTDEIFWSTQQRRQYGLDSDEPATLEKSLSANHPEDKERIERVVRNAHDPAGNGRFDVAHRIIRHDGSVRWLATRSQTTFEGEGSARRPVRTIGAVLDITSRKFLVAQLVEARDHALEASRLKSEFLANMSHEIRTPMNGIVGIATLLGDTPLNAAQQEVRRVKLGSAETLLEIINDILDFSKIEAGKMRVEAAEFDLRQTVATDRVLYQQAHREPFQPRHLSGVL